MLLSYPVATYSRETVKQMIPVGSEVEDYAFISIKHSAWTLSLLEDTAKLTLSFSWLKSRPFYLPQEFTASVVTAAYIPPNADAKIAMNEHSHLQTTHCSTRGCIYSSSSFQSF